MTTNGENLSTSLFPFDLRSFRSIFLSGLNLAGNIRELLGNLEPKPRLEIFPFLWGVVQNCIIRGKGILKHFKILAQVW